MFQKNTQIKLQNNLFITHLKRHYLQGDSRQIIKQLFITSTWQMKIEMKGQRQLYSMVIYIRVY